MEHSFSLDTTSYKEAKEKAAAFWVHSTTPLVGMRIYKKQDTGIWHIYYRPSSALHVEN